jgi:hypothetical protein
MIYQETSAWYHAFGRRCLSTCKLADTRTSCSVQATPLPRPFVAFFYITSSSVGFRYTWMYGPHRFPVCVAHDAAYPFRHGKCTASDYSHTAQPLSHMGCFDPDLSGSVHAKRPAGAVNQGPEIGETSRPAPCSRPY